MMRRLSGGRSGGRSEGKEAEAKDGEAESKDEAKDGESKEQDEAKYSEEDDERRRETAAVRLQGVHRSREARRRVFEKARLAFEIGYDEESKEYFYYNKVSGESIWEPPMTLRGAQPYLTNNAAKWASTLLAARIRGCLARQRLPSLVPEVYRRDYDTESRELYYTDRRTGQSRWDKPGTAGDESSFEVGEDSRLLMERDSEIARLRAVVEQKDAEIEEAKSATHADLDKDLRLRRMAQALKGQRRAKNLNEWRNEHVVAWFVELEMDQYVPALVASRVDGLLLLNMDEDDFRELGVTKRLHQRKIDIALRKYKIRYDRAQGQIVEENMDDDDDDGLDLDDTSSESNGSSNGSVVEVEQEEQFFDDEDDDVLPTEEELLELNRDRQHVQLEVVIPGDEETYPKVGDIVRCHYVCSLYDDPSVIVENTRKKRKPFEFVLGIGQVIRGWERGILQMSFGERSKLTVSAEYSYGKIGCMPLIPPNSDLVFDLELIRWRPRKIWTKPWLQNPGLTEHPFEEELEPETIDEAFVLDQDSSSMPMMIKGSSFAVEEGEFGDDSNTVITAAT